MRAFSATAGVVADPACAVQDVIRDSHHQCKQVEVAELIDVIGIKETFSGDTVRHDGGDLGGPRKFAENEENENHENRIADEPLKTVGHNQGNPSRGPDHDHGENQAENQNQDKRGNRHAEDRNSVRQSEEVDEEARGNGGPDRVRQHFGNRPERRGKDAERTVVAHLKELPHRHRFRFAETVKTVTGQ